MDVNIERKRSESVTETARTDRPQLAVRLPDPSAAPLQHGRVVSIRSFTSLTAVSLPRHAVSYTIRLNITYHRGVSVPGLCIVLDVHTHKRIFAPPPLLVQQYVHFVSKRYF